MGPPTANISPGSPRRSTTLPETGEVISTVALSVITSTSGWSSSTRSPTATCQATISASAVPSPTSGRRKVKRPMAQPSITRRMALATRSGPGK